MKIRSVYPYGTSCVFGLNMRRRNIRVSASKNAPIDMRPWTYTPLAWSLFRTSNMSPCKNHTRLVSSGGAQDELGLPGDLSHSGSPLGRKRASFSSRSIALAIPHVLAQKLIPAPIGEILEDASYMSISRFLSWFMERMAADNVSPPIPAPLFER